MNCAYHSDREAQGVCSTCGRPACSECLVELKGQAYCKTCLEARVRKPARDVSGALRFILSLVPGLGHLYMGLFERGLQLVAGFVLGMVVLGIAVEGFSVLFAFAVIFFSIFDAREAHLRIAQGLDVEDKGFVDWRNWKPSWNSRYVGYGLIGLGGLALYRTIISDMLRLFIRDWTIYRNLVSAVNGVMLGLIFLGLGLWILRKGAGRQENG